jgi:hypothetical protein
VWYTSLGASSVSGLNVLKERMLKEGRIIDAKFREYPFT